MTDYAAFELKLAVCSVPDCEACVPEKEMFLADGGKVCANCAGQPVRLDLVVGGGA